MCVCVYTCFTSEQGIFDDNVIISQCKNLSPFDDMYWTFSN